MPLPCRALVLKFLLLCPVLGAGAGEFRFGTQTLTVPEGLVVERVAGAPLVERPVTMDFDERGRLYVSESSGSNAKVEEQLAEKPHRILRLADADGDGVFEARTVFADGMMLPEGTLWFGGSLYVSAPPVIWKLTDADDDGVADRREVWFDGKTLTGCANDLHGPYLGRDGRIYWCKGAFAEQTHDLPGRPGWKSRASHIFRALPDGSALEPVLTGGMDNPVDVVFTPEGERLLSCTFLQHPAGGRRDGLIHALYGGVYGKDHDVLDGHPRTGGLLLPMAHLGPAAPCGLHLMESDGLGADYRGSVFATQFNLRKVSRHALRHEGAALASTDADFLTSDSTDFHPTDVIEDADGSLLVCDTGGWYTLCCPTSQIAKPEVGGAIYRVRRAGAARAEDPRGLRISLKGAEPSELTPYLTDARPVMRRRAMDGLVATGGGAVPALDFILRWGDTKEERLRAVWTLCRMPGAAAREAARVALEDADATVRHAACHAAGLWRDGEAAGALSGMVADDSAPVRRAAAEALGRLGRPEVAEVLFGALRGDDDRALFHSIAYAALESGNADAARTALDDGSAVAKAAALYVLEQLPEGVLAPESVLVHLRAEEPRLREAAHWVSARHPDWADTLASGLMDGIEAGTVDVPADFADLLSRAEEARRRVARGAHAGHPWAHAIVAAKAPDGLPDAWIDALFVALDADVGTVGAIASLGMVPVGHPRRGEIDAALMRRALADPGHGLAALEAIPEFAGPLPDESFAALVEMAGGGADALTRLAAARILARAKPDGGQLDALADLSGRLGAMEANALLPAFAAASAECRAKLFAGLGSSPALPSLRPDLLAAVPDEGGTLPGLLAAIDRGRAARAARLEELGEALADADGERGHHVFHGTRAGCSACHALGYVGGDLGPDLSRIGGVRTERDLLEAIVYPGASLVRSYETVVVTRADGSTVAGILRGQNAEGVTVALAPGARLHVPAAEVRSVEPAAVSLMPVGFDGILTVREVSDLVRFLKERQ